MPPPSKASAVSIFAQTPHPHPWCDIWTLPNAKSGGNRVIRENFLCKSLMSFYSQVLNRNPWISFQNMEDDIWSCSIYLLFSVTLHCFRSRFLNSSIPACRCAAFTRASKFRLADWNPWIISSLLTLLPCTDGSRLVAYSHLLQVCYFQSLFQTIIWRKVCCRS